MSSRQSAVNSRQSAVNSRQSAAKNIWNQNSLIEHKFIVAIKNIEIFVL